MKKTILYAAALLSAFSMAPALAEASQEKKHIPGVFLGYTDANGETEFSYGLEYEYKFNRSWGAGLIYEKTEKAHHGDGVEVKIAALYLHPWKDLRLGVGAGKEEVGGHHPHSEDLYRASVSYDFHVGEFGIAPTVAIDFVDGDTATVFGISIVRPF